jgi:hypothetical protein
MPLARSSMAFRISSCPLWWGYRRGELTQVLLQFSNPARAEFSFTPQLLAAAVETPSITGISPQEGASGTFVVLSGTGFTPTSSITFGNTHAYPVTFISKETLGVVVPFSEQNGQVVPLQIGMYPISVDGGQTLDFTVTGLPENPNPPGAVLSQAIDTITEQYVLSRPELGATLLQLQADAQDPATVQYLVGDTARFPDFAWSGVNR